MTISMPEHTTEDTAGRIRDFLVETGDWQGPREELTDDLPLLRDVLDSLAVMNVVLWIESDLGVAVDDDDLEPANFATIATIAAFIQQRRR
jgi:acyl carrier protein